jgi:hypothetical protein
MIRPHFLGPPVLDSVGAAAVRPKRLLRGPLHAVATPYPASPSIDTLLGRASVIGHTARRGPSGPRG